MSSVLTVAMVVLGAFVVSVTTLSPPAAAATYFFDDFESGGGAWTTTGWWHWVDDAVDPCRIGAFSGGGSFGYHIDTSPPATPGNACTYDEDDGFGFSVTNSGDLTSPLIDLTTAGSARLTFMSWIEEEAAVNYEGFGLLVSDTGGASWALTSFAADDPAFLQATWEAREFDLTPWAGRVIQLRFAFDTRDPATNNLRGWFLDNVQIDDFPASTITFLADNFDTGSPGWVAAGQWHQVGPADTCGFGARSPPTYWGYHLDFFCDYDSGGTAADRLESPPIDLTSAVTARLTFWSIYGLDNPPGDTVIVQVFSGAVWTDVLDLNLAGYPMNAALYVDIDLGAYVGGIVQVGFLFSHDTSVNNVQGWFIDDMAVRGTRHTIRSAWKAIPPVADGVFGGFEHILAANVADLTAIPGNGLWAYLVVENDPNFLYITYDVPGDTIPDPGDAASIAFDTDRNLAGTDAADDQLIVDGTGLGDHRMYSTGSGTWVSEDPCDSFFAPDHTGLRCASGFGPSPYFAAAHRIYEFQIPLALLDVPLPVQDGYLLAALGGSSIVPGVLEGGTALFDTWPVALFGFPPLVEFGDIALAGSPGPCSSLTMLLNDVTVVCPLPFPSHYFGFDVAPFDSDNAVVGIRPPAGVDYDLGVFPDTTFGGSLKDSFYGAGAIDFIGVRGPSWAGSTLGAAVFQQSGTGDYTMEMEHDLVDVPMPGTSGGFMNTFEVLDAFDIDGAAPGTTYEVSLTMDTFLDLDLYVLGFTSGSVEGRADAWITSELIGNGVVERGTFTPFSTGPFLVVVTNPIGGSGAYTLTISDGLCPGIQYLFHSSPLTCDAPTPPDAFDFFVGAPLHAVVGIRPPPVTGAYNLWMYPDTTYQSWIEASIETGAVVDFVALHGPTWNFPPTRGALVLNSGGSGDYQIEMENSMPFLSSPFLYSESMDALMGGVEVLDSVQVTGLTPGTDYRLDLVVPPGADLDLYIMAFIGDTAQSRFEANWVSATLGAGFSESITFTAPIAGDYLIVVTNEHIGAGPGTGPYDLLLGVANQAPVLSATGELNYVGDGLDPEFGFIDTPYTYRVLYTDGDDDAPAFGDPLLHILQAGFDIPGSPFVMNEDDPFDITYNDGKIYTLTTLLPFRALDYTYYFTATDVRGSVALGWPGPTLDAPDIFNSAPVISYSGAVGYTVDGVEFDVGTTMDLFTFEVLYQDADNDAPTLVYAYVQDPLGTDIPGSPFGLGLFRWIGAPGDFVAGAVYGTPAGLPAGSLWHGFWAEDGLDAAVGPALSYVNLPTVLDPLMVDWTAWAPATVNAGQTDVLMLQLTLSAFTNPITVDALTLELSGLPPDPADVSQVTVWLDDGDGLFDAVLDTPVGTSSVWVGSPSTVTVDLLPDVTVSTTGISDLFVTFDIAAGAIGGHWIGVRLDTPSRFLLLPGGLVMPVNFPIDTYAPGVATQIFLPPGPPALSYTGEVGYVTDGVDLDSGPRGGFTFRVLYQDGDNAPPAFVRLVLERAGGVAYGASPYAMTFDSWLGAPNDYVSGARYQVVVPITNVGTDFVYYFEADDGAFPAGGPAVSPLAGPIVVNRLPTLTLGAVTPTTGATGTAYNWTVTYTDPDDDAPASLPSVQIRKAGADILGSPYVMIEADALDTTYSDGKEYFYGRTLVPCGTDYDFTFSASDSLAGAATPLGPIAGPDVTGCTGTAPVLDWTGETSYTTDGLNPENGTTLTVFEFRVQYTDVDNDAPATGSPLLHVLDAGAEIAGSPFTMSFATWIVTPNDYVAGALFNAVVSLPVGTNYTYYFDATDVAGNPVVYPGTPVDAPDVIAVANRAPTAIAGTGQSVFRNVLVTLAGSAMDPDGDTLSYSWAFVSGPATPTLTGLLTATPSFTPVTPGIYVVRLTVDDGNGGTDTDDVSIAVTNRAPSIGTTTPASPVTVAIAGNQLFTSAVTDLDGDTLTYTWTLDGLPVGTNQDTHSFSPTASGTFTLVLRVSDGITTDDQTVTWTITVPPGGTTAPTDLTLLIVAVIIVGAVAGLLLFLLWFRRRKKPEPDAGPTTLADAMPMQEFGGEAPAATPAPSTPFSRPAEPTRVAPPAATTIAPTAPPVTPPAASTGPTDAERKLTKLKQLRDSGLISEEEFQREKKAALDKV